MLKVYWELRFQGDLFVEDGTEFYANLSTRRFGPRLGDYIQEHLKVRFGSGMSNTTLKKLAEKTDEVAKLQKKLEKTEQVLKLYKQLYFDLIKSLKQNLY